MTGEARSPAGAAAIVVAACAPSLRGRPTGSDAALLAAVASGNHDELLVLRHGPWPDCPVRLGGCRLRLIRSPVGGAWAAGPAVRKHAGESTVPVWAEPSDLGSLRGFARAAVSAGATDAGIARLAESLAGSATHPAAKPRGDEQPKEQVANLVVLGSHPARLDARAVVFATSLVAVSGQSVRAVVPRGTRNMDSARRYPRRLDLPLSLEASDGPSWLEAAGADAVLLDREHESSTQFGPALIALAEALGKPIVDLPGALPVGGRDARRYGQPLLEALERTLGRSGATVPSA